MLDRINSIEKISISSINFFINDKHRWICENIYGCTSPVDQRNPYFWRGSILEAEVQECSNSLKTGVGYDKSISLERALSKYDLLVSDNKDFINSDSELLDAVNKQRKFIENCVNNNVIYNAVTSLESIVKYQQPLSRKIFNTSFRLTGIADFVTEKSVVEMKTKSNIAVLSNNHIRQVVYYNYILEGLIPKLLYINDTAFKVYSVKDQLIKSYMFQIFDAVKEIDDIIHMSDAEISNKYKLDVNNELFNEPNYKNVATDLWS